MMETTWLADSLDDGLFTPSRLTLARERRGLTKQALADLCGVSRRTVTAWESGRVDHPPVELLSEVLDFPQDFFLADEVVPVDPDAVSFRALSTMTARQVHRVLAASTLAVELARWMDDHYRTPSAQLPDLSDSEGLDPVVAAETTRRVWDLNDGPIKNLLGLLERKGVRVFSLPVPDREVDAFSFWQEDRPYIFLNTGRTAERMRFDLAHELGHLLLHKETICRRARDIEQQAQDFASSFLMPADALDEQIIGSPQLHDIFNLKRYWKVSAVAMVHRLYQLGIISEWANRTWMIELSERGFRSTEPDGIRPETSKLFKQLFALAREDGWSHRRIAKTLHISEDELNTMVFGLAVTSAPRDVSAIVQPSVPGNVKIRLVE